MFGKPTWFRKHTFGWGLTPICWQGWVYTLVLASGIAIPFNFLMFVWPGNIVQAMIWFVAAVGFVIWDAREMMRAMEQEERKSLFHIGEEDTDSQVATRNFDLQVRE